MGIRVLSLFDGISCGQIALDQLGIEVKDYYASETDKYAIEITQKNYPNTIQVGDVCDLKGKDFQNIDLMIFGPPCQGFSFAGKQLAFDDPRSKLFFEAVRLLREIKPKYFLMENVRMKKEFLQIITEQLSNCYPEILFGIEPILINSSLVSAQSRQRYYWTNIPNVTQPKERGIVLQNILETNISEELSPKAKRYMKSSNPKWTHGKPRAEHYIRHESQKSLTLTANMHKGVPHGVIAVNKPKQVGKVVEQVKLRKHKVDVINLQKLLLDSLNKSGKSRKQIAKELNTKFSTVEHYFRGVGSKFFSIPSEEHWPKLKKILDIESNQFDKQILEFVVKDGVWERKQRVYGSEGKSPTVTSTHADIYIQTKPKQVGIATDINGHDYLKRVYSPDGKSPTLTACGGGNTEPKVLTGGRIVGRAYDKDGKRMDRDGSSVANKTKQMLELRKDGKSNAITTVGKDSVVVNGELTWRRLSCLECERLQTVPDNYTEGVSNTQRYKCLGNSFTVEVIKHILQNIK